MLRFRPAKNDYVFEIFYRGKNLRYVIKKYHSDDHASYYQLYAANRVLDLKFNWRNKELLHITLYGETSAPRDFLDVLEKDFVSLFS